MEWRGLPDELHVSGRAAWVDAVLATLRSRDAHVSDAEIFAILNASSDGERADLCVARDISIPLYCLWKTKYRKLNVDEIARTRRRELWRLRLTRGALAASVLLAAATPVYLVARTAQPMIAAALRATAPVAAPGAQPLLAGAPGIGRLDGSAEARPPAPAVQNEAPPPRLPPATGADFPAPGTAAAVQSAVARAATAARGYNVQVTAAETFDEGRVFVERLAAAGHRAYIFPAFVGPVEVFRVRVGPFATRAQAEESAARLQREGHPEAWVVYFGDR